MIFSVGPQFSYEIGNKITHVKMLEKYLNEYFSDKDYGNSVEKIYIAVLCFKEYSIEFLKPRPLKILRKEPALEFEFSIDFNTFLAMNVESSHIYLWREFYNSTVHILKGKKIQNFDTDSFLKDIEAFFANA